MTRILRMQKFGCFADTEIPLGDTTVIVGGNESEKTTVYRALRAAAIGACDEGEVELIGQTECVSPNEFEVHHGAAEGCIHFGRDASGVDLDAALSKELDACIDLSHVVQDLSERASDDPRSPYQQELAELRARYQELESQRQQAWSTRQVVLTAGDEMADLAQQIESRERELARLDEEIPSAAAEFETKRGLLLRARLHDEKSRELHRVREQLRDTTAQSELGELRASELEEFDRIDEDLRHHLQQMEDLEERRRGGQDRLGRVAAEIEHARAEEPLRRRASHRATAIKLQLVRFLDEPKTVERRVWSRARVLGFLILVALVLVAAALGSFTPHVGLGLSMTVVSLTLFLGRSTVRRNDDEALPAFLQQLAQQWDGEGLAPMPSSSSEAVLSFLDAQIRAYEQLCAALAEAVDYECRVERELAGIVDCSYDMLQHTLISRQKALDEWLEEHGIENRDDLIARRREQQRLRECIASRADLPVDDKLCAKLESELEKELGELVERGIVPHSEEDIPALELRLEQMRRDKKRAETELAELKMRRVEITTGVGTRVRYAQTVSEAVAQQRQIAKAIAGLEEELRAFAEATQLVSEMAGDETLGLSILNEVLAEFMGLSGFGRSVELRGFSEADLVVGEKLHGIGELSSGGRDLVVLAARLTVTCLLHGSSLPLLVLEEPFLRMDRALTLGALRMLELFQRHTGWRLVLISRDLDLPDQVSGVFASIEKVELEVPRRGVQDGHFEEEKAKSVNSHTATRALCATRVY